MLYSAGSSSSQSEGATSGSTSRVPVRLPAMINYTERISLLMEDIVERVPALSFIDMSRLLVFARAGRTGADGAYATCHCICLPPSEPGYYFWRDRTSGRLTRRSEWFVTKSPDVRIGTQTIDYMISFALPRFSDQSLSRSRKRVHYADEANWVAKLDTIIHELYHIDPERPGIRRMERSDGTYSANCHGRRFFEDVVAMVKQYIASGPDPKTYDFLQYSFDELTERFGGIVGTTFRAFPSYPQRYSEVLDLQPASSAEMDCPVEPLKVPRVTTRFTENDLVVREFQQTSSRQLTRKGQFVAA
jgi:hypothetical protein